MKPTKIVLPSILIIEDSPRFQSFLVAALTKENIAGKKIMYAENISQARTSIEEQPSFIIWGGILRNENSRELFTIIKEAKLTKKTIFMTHCDAMAWKDECRKYRICYMNKAELIGSKLRSTIRRKISVKKTTKNAEQE